MIDAARSRAQRAATGLALALAVLALAALAVGGCACDPRIGLGRRDDGGGALDARAVATRADECGNGIDDDGDGRIDQGCPCGPGETQACFGGARGSRSVGVCSDGVQVCAPQGVEWGDWGQSHCAGDVRPMDQTCSGTDTDCDGAIDEGCPCTAGETVPCASEFLEGGCRAGVQTCGGDGVWSGCDGAVGPLGETCGDGVDQDCDGAIDERCGCVPAPEVCRDGIDNDCDGAIDEPACEPDWPPSDVGPCDPALEPPRLRAPSSTSRVTSTRPTLEWTLPPGAIGATIELARDRALGADPVVGHALGTAWRPESPIAAGAHFWRARARAADGRVSCATSATWELFAPHRDRGTDTFGGAVMDVDGDGLADVLFTAEWNPTASSTEKVIHVFFGRIDRTWTAPDQTVDVPGASRGGAVVACGDIDGDGFGDALAFGSLVFRGSPAGLIADPWLTLESASPSVALRFVGDVDRDGYTDLAQRDASASTIVIRRGSPTGLHAGSAPLAYVGATPPDALALGDLTGDRYADVLASEGNSTAAGMDTRGTLTIFEGSPSGTSLMPTRASIRAPVTSFWGPGQGIDANGDGLRDWISTFDHDVVRFGGPRGLADPPSQELDRSHNTIAIGDTDGDGYDDALANETWTTSGGAAATAIHRGSPTGLAVTATESIRDRHEWYGAVGDVDGDGLDDAFMIDLSGPDVNSRTFVSGDPTGPWLVGHVYFGGAGGLIATRRAALSVRTVPLDALAAPRVRFVVEYLHSAM
jgi:hypothetical protein